MEYTFKLIDIDVESRNKHIYPRNEVVKMVNRFKKKKKDFLCSNFDIVSNIILNNVSHILKDLYIDDNKLICTINTICTDNGKRLDDIISTYTNNNLIAIPIGMGIIEEKANIISNYKLLNIKIVPNWSI